MGAGNLANLPTSYSNIDFPGLSLAVSPNTEYWITLTTDSSSHTLNWSYSNTAISGTAYSGFSGTPATWSTVSTGAAPQQMAVVAVPEPAAFAWMSVLGLLGYALRRVRFGRASGI